MKKIWLAMVVVLLLGLVAGCGSDEETDIKKSETVTLNLPSGLFAGQSKEDIIQSAEIEGIKAVVNNDDSVTYTMTAEKQQELLLGFKTHFEEALQSALDNGELPGVVNVSYNELMSEFEVSVDRDTYETQSDMMDFGRLYSAGTAYQLYAGKSEEQIDVRIVIVDKKNNKEIDAFSMREAFVAQQSPGDSAD